MEHAQRGGLAIVPGDLDLDGLNPYFNGTCSKSRPNGKRFGKRCISLNPYFNGTCSKSRNPKSRISPNTKMS